ncbi:putative ferric-chelate reductase 1 [Gouania willdenowi]|uniref:putative ferric-chelate reductase 1 n=1 Tax=Gouania willdenowi TaxID=441366 RepID=UPI0010551F8F|nr:putative ferric-chelate reductase 1 [Gouania willdenowi]
MFRVQLQTKRFRNRMLTARLCVLCVVCVCCVQRSVCFSNGSVSYSCDHMIPGHSSIAPSLLSAPYAVSASSATYRPGQKLTVTLSSSSTQFKGFLLQARSSEHTVTEWPIGSFTDIDPAHFTALDCNNMANSSVSQSSGVQKTSVQITWEAPSNSSYGDIYFCVSVVQSYTQFWVKVNSSSLSLDSSTTSAAAVSSSSSSSLLFIVLLSVLHHLNTLHFLMSFSS